MFYIRKCRQIWATLAVNDFFFSLSLSLHTGHASYFIALEKAWHCRHTEVKY